MIRLRSLGECVIDLGEVQVGPQSEVLFALLLYLIVERGHRVPRTRLVELLWPGESDERARHNLRQAIYKARQLGAAIGQEGGDFVLLATAASADYDALLAPPVDGSAPSVDLATLDFLPSFDGAVSEAYAEWLDDQRAVIHSALRRHLVAAIARARRLVRWNEVERLARRCLALDPMNEEAVLGLAEATAASGSRALAAATLDRYLEELGPDAKLLGKPVRELRRRILEVRESELTPRTVFVGREKELILLTDHLDRALAGEGVAILLSGPPGIGKSALVHQLNKLAQLRGFASAPVHTPCAGQPQALSVYTAVVEALLQLPGALGCSPDALEYCQLLLGARQPENLSLSVAPGRIQRCIQDSVVELAFAVTEEAPLLVIVEDVHWADGVSLERIGALSRALRGARALIVLTGRPPLSAQWPGSFLEDVRVLDVRGLEQDAAGELLASRAGRDETATTAYSNWCLRVAQGHPLYLRELGDRWRRHGESYEAPPSLASLLNARLKALHSRSLRTLQLCALLSRDSTLARLQTATGLPLSDFTTVVEELEAADVAFVDEEMFTIRHELISDAALALIGPGTRRLLHKQIALLLEADPTTVQNAAALWRCAEHWLAAGEAQRAANATYAAAEHLLGIGLPDQAAELLRVYLPSIVDPTERARVLRLSARANRDLGNWRRVIESAEEAATIAGPGSTAHNRCELSALHAAWRANRLEMRELFARAEGCAVSRDADDEHRVESVTLALIFADELLDRTALERVYAIACRDFPIERCTTLESLRPHLIFQSLAGDLDQAVSIARRGIRLAEVGRNPVVLAASLRQSMIPLRLAAHFDEAFACGERALELSLTSGIPDQIVLSANAIAMLCLAAGRPEDALRYATLGHENLSALDSLNGRSHSAPALAAAALHSGDLALAAAYAEEMPRIADDGITRTGIQSLCMRALVAIHRKRYDELEFVSGRLSESLHQAAFWSGLDTLAQITVFALRRLGRRGEGDKLLASYLSQRREQYAFVIGRFALCASETGPADGRAVSQHPTTSR